MFMDKEADLKNLIQKRDKITTNLFWLMLKIAFIIGIPAFIAAFFGKRLDTAKETGLTFTIIFLAAAFIISWVIIYFEYKKISKDLKFLEDQIVALRKELKEEEEKKEIKE